MLEWARENEDRELFAESGGPAKSAIPDPERHSFQPNAMGWRWY
jgi:hypothetical protein